MMSKMGDDCGRNGLPRSTGLEMLIRSSINWRRLVKKMAGSSTGGQLGVGDG